MFLMGDPPAPSFPLLQHRHLQHKASSFHTTFPATTVEGLGLCGEIAPPDCRSEGISKDAPESYVWWPTRNFLTPDAEAIAPPGSRAAHVGAGFAVAAPRLLE